MPNSEVQDFINEFRSPFSTLVVQTSGSTGTPKQICVEKSQMVASAERTCRALNLRAGDVALLCLPLKYIAGKMMVVRALVADLQLVEIEPSGHPLADVPAGTRIDFAAMTPMQIFNTLSVPAEKEKLKSIKKIIIGGAAIDEKMEAELRAFPNEIYSTYGMTETLSHIALRRISGNTERGYRVLPRIKIARGNDDCLVINDTLKTNDIVEILDDGSFLILGRKDNVVNSGGIKIQLEQVETQLRAANAGTDLMLTSVPDEKFGEILVALVCGNAKINCDFLKKFERPKQIIRVPALPLTATHKPDRMAAKKIAKNFKQK